MVANRIEREIVVNAPVERVWAVLTEPDHIGQWFGVDPPSDVDLRPGGTMTFDHGDAGRFPVHIERFDPPTTFAYRWASDFPGEQPEEANSTLVEFTLAAEGPSTRLTVTETGFASLALPVDQQHKSYQDNVTGWRVELSKLRAYAEQTAA